MNDTDAINRSLLLSQLITTERHISAVARNVLRQQSLVAELERRGHDSTYARALLHHLGEMQAMRIADRDRMRAELERHASSAGDHVGSRAGEIAGDHAGENAFPAS